VEEQSVGVGTYLLYFLLVLIKFVVIGIGVSLGLWLFCLVTGRTAELPLRLFNKCLPKKEKKEEKK
jgi:hypothetical protein